ncbi:uncharacterized protein LOC114761862 [Neltuma alba]|uniref:uncharacterized protein LOC114761862 n=1 Tax=Neltuma alba TaxID=207710 RepID=UPI0010A3BBF8|nr:uncharacterized protein LOC114761862 [Prosopis alba]
MVGLSPSEVDKDVYNQAETILANAFAEWEIILCSSTTNLDLVWAQMITDPFLRRLILRFIFCRSAISFYCPPEESEQCMPLCLPHLPHICCTGFWSRSYCRCSDCYALRSG